MTWNQVYAPVGGNIGLSALVATIPLLVLFYALAIKRMKGNIAALLTLATAFLIAVLVYGMPVSIALSATGYGIANGLLPIGWVVFSAVFLYNLTVDAGQFEIIKNSISSLTDDRRLQAIFIAFCFGAFLEGAAGFGTPVAIAGAVLIGLGFQPLYAAGICLLANVGPVAFGGIGIPIITAAKVTGLSETAIGLMTAKQLFLVTFLTPCFLSWVISGWKGAKEVLPATILTGGIFAIVQLLVNMYSGPMLANILSSLLAMGFLTFFLKVWKPKNIYRFSHDQDVRIERDAKEVYTGRQIFRAWSPFIFLTIFVSIWGYRPFADFINKTLHWSFSISVPGLDQLVMKTAPIVTIPTPYEAVYKLSWFTTPGTAIFLAAIATMLIFKIKPAKFVQVFQDTFKQLQIPLLTIASVLGFAYLANYSGLSYTLGLALTITGTMFPFFSPFLGWIGVFLTGSDTSANALFAKLQQVTAEKLGIDPVITVAANSSGGVMGKMISPQSIAVACAATGQVGKESELLRFTVKYSLIFVTLMGVLITIQTYLLK